MKLLTKKQILKIEKDSFIAGKYEGIEMITDFLKNLKTIEIYNKPMTIDNANKKAIIKNCLFINTKYGIKVYTDDEKSN